MTARTFVVAEAGVNHNGSLARALEMVAAAADAGADAVKFQTFLAEDLAVPSAPMADYQVRATGADGGQLAMLKSLELDRQSHLRLAEACRSAGIEFMSTAFDVKSLKFLVEEAGVKRIKVPSGEVTNPMLLLAVGRCRLPLLISTGMATMAEVADALSVILFAMSNERAPPSARALRSAGRDGQSWAALAHRVTLLQCTTAYPAPEKDLNLRAMAAMADHFGLPVGFSDHSMGAAAALASVACGATVVEKHFTMDRSLRGPDHAASLEPNELGQMIAGIRAVESALGSGEKAPAESERANIRVARRGLYAARPIKKGDVLKESDFLVLRPENGTEPMAMWDMVGQEAQRSYQRFDPIS